MQHSIEVTAEQTRGEAGVCAAIAQLIHFVRADVEVLPRSTWLAATAAAMKLSGVQYAGIMRVRHGDCIRTVASTTGHPRMLDQLQQRFQEGPSLDAAWENQTRRVDHFAAERRWPTFSDEAAATTPIRSMLSVPLVTHCRGRTVLNMYADQPYAFGRDDELIALMFARNAEALLEFGRSSKRYGYQNNRELIRQAKRILMQRRAVDAATALSLLAQLSKDRGQPVSVVARGLVGTRLQQ
ncbi:hypothetical protein BVC93_12875 [Mycobacterium sp. MS1601]|uniref:GAF and ANTAR domain-containing protein n=1 Tax=Mycobacterium sp. MS1601 TaxID=1936029 RepID=UPI00097911B2|nr:GAF and ANTAR domain-containing protein [Mycobacterium sp. MS1601]AQA03170.1 hypothetical protein BVC93_12875 [Mycobacterium sp. MS1601]